MYVLPRRQHAMQRYTSAVASLCTLLLGGFDGAGLEVELGESQDRTQPAGLHWVSTSYQ